MIHAIELRGAIAHAVQLTQQAYNAFEKAKEAQFLSDEYASEGLEEKAAQCRVECSAYRRACDVDIGTVTDLLAWLAQHVEMSPIEQQTVNAAMLMSVDGTKPSARPPAADLYSRNIENSVLNYHQFDPQSNPSQSAHPYKLFYVEYVRTNNKLRYPEAEAAKAYFNLRLDKNERSERIAKAGGKEKAIASFVRSFKYKLK